MTLPVNWRRCRLDEICTVIMGQSPPSETYNTVSAGLPFFQGKAEFGEVYPTVEKWCSSPTKLAEEDDVLLSIRAPVGPTNLAPAQCGIGRGLAALRPKSGLSARYLLYAMKRFANELAAKGAGTTFEAVSAATVRGFEIPVAPEAEQAQIVAKLDEFLSDLEAGVANLKRAQANLKRYRSAILKSAVEGGLTEEWRKQTPPTETGEQLLTRILNKRRIKWEADQLGKFAKQRKSPPKGWQSKYIEPAAPDTTNLPKLPEGWCWAAVGQLTTLITSGSRGWADYYSESGATFIRSQDINTDKLVLDSVAHVTLPVGSEGTRTRVEKHDVLITITGANVAKCAVVSVELDEAYVSQHVALARLADIQMSAYLQLFLTCEAAGRKQLLKYAYGAGKPGLNLQQVSSVAIPLPPLEEQFEITSLADDLLSVISATETETSRQLKKAASLRQSIFQAAFSGKLIEEPSSNQATNEAAA